MAGHAGNGSKLPCAGGRAELPYPRVLLWKIAVEIVVAGIVRVSGLRSASGLAADHLPLSSAPSPGTEVVTRPTSLMPAPRTLSITLITMP